ncbi:hypothetical protein GBAR_LOCUS29037 [Geodia barretti]|uniref:Uncharacterized protein n=1 Tax=Geodia barretti TaxID=519541 RepID=A0AA35TSL1_GEOBA|nr:hypothetical protein GBAR_LOCUS29037 [Geodia barretti]
MTPRESYELGMRSQPAWEEKLEVFVREDGERGVRALTAFRDGEFLCEFEANLLSKAQCEKAEKEYEADGKPVYILEVCCFS